VLRWLSFNTLGTHVLTRLRGELVGEDWLGNRYYQERGRRDWRHKRRWVVYAGREPDPNLVPPGWSGWLQKRREHPPSKEPLPEPRYERPPMSNPTGTDEAYVPPGHLRRGGRRDPATGDYEAWRP
jgi:NADH:ubiquinone oxidoreductase subunit